MKTFSITFTLTILLMAGCKSQKDMDRFSLPNTKTDRPVILATNPTDGFVGFQSTEAVWIQFDRAMDQQKTEDAFHLSSDRSAVEGAFHWEFDRLIFQSRTALITGQAYTMTLGQASESSSGVDLGKDTTIHFFAGTDIDSPHFLSSVPAANATAVNPALPIRLSFSEPMSYASIASGISIAPSFSYTISMQNGGKDIVLIPSNPLVNGTYQVTYSNTLTDLAGLAIVNEGSFLFTVGSDFIPPALLSVHSGSASLTENILTAGVEKSDKIILQFSEPMNQISVEDALSISPSRASSRKWNSTGDQLEITFTPSLDPETNYTLTLSSSATDPEGNALTRVYSYPFLTSGPNSTRPRVIEAQQFSSSSPVADSTSVCTEGASPQPPSGLPLTNLQVFFPYQLIDVNSDPGAVECVLQFRFTFNNEMIRTSLVNATDQPTYIIAPDSGNGTSVDARIYDLQLDLADRHIMILSIQGYFPSSTAGLDATPIIQFRIRGGSGGATDIFGNQMAEDYVLYLTY